MRSRQALTDLTVKDQPLSRALIMKRKSDDLEKIDAHKLPRSELLTTASRMLSEANNMFAATGDELSKVQADLDRREQAVQLERQQMASVPVADNDIIRLDICGTLISTKRSTLTQADGSSLAARFSGSWDQCLDRDPLSGRVFLDVDPYCFQQILQYLQLRNTNAAEDVPLPYIVPEKLFAYANLVKYFFLEQYMGYSRTSALDVVCAHAGIVVLGDCVRQVRMTDTDSSYKSVYIREKMRQDKVHIMKCKMSKGHTVLGICATVRSSSSKCMQQAIQATYGWSNLQQTYQNGVQTCKRDGWSDKYAWHEGSEVVIIANFSTSTLKLESPECSLQISIPQPAATDSVVFHCAMAPFAAGLDILPVTEADRSSLV